MSENKNSCCSTTNSTDVCKRSRSLSKSRSAELQEQTTFQLRCCDCDGDCSLSAVSTVAASNVTCGDSSALNINSIINDIFKKRIVEIDEKVEGDCKLKVLTLSEWVQSLLHINHSLIVNIKELELEAGERLSLMQRKSGTSCRLSQSGNELTKSRKDIENLLKLIQRAKHSGEWDLCGLQFETLTENEIFGDSANDEIYCSAFQIPSDELRCCEKDVKPNLVDPQQCKLVSNMRALAVEVAEKHDEIRDLKQQVLCLEDEIQKAQQKIQLKDDVIKELRNDLKTSIKCLACKAVKQSDCRSSPVSCPSAMSTNKFGGDSSFCTETETDCCLESGRDFNEPGCHMDSYCHEDFDDDERIQTLKKELDTLCNSQDVLNRGIEDQRRLMCQQQRKVSNLVHQWINESIEANRKLEFFRRELINLDVAGAVTSGAGCSTDADSGISSKADVDPDAKIVELVRRRICKMNDNSTQLKKQNQKLEIEKNDLCSQLKTQTDIYQKNIHILKEIACTLTDLTGKEVCYEKMYSNDSRTQQTNPFCDAILCLQTKMMGKDEEICAMRNQLCTANKKIEETEEALCNKDHTIEDLERSLKQARCPSKAQSSKERSIEVLDRTSLGQARCESKLSCNKSRCDNKSVKQQPHPKGQFDNSSSSRTRSLTTYTPATTNTKKTPIRNNRNNKPTAHNPAKPDRDSVDKKDDKKDDNYNPPAWNW